MAKGDPPENPWFEDFHDDYSEYLAEQAGNPHSISLYIEVPWDPATGNLLNGGYVRRDPDCRVSRIVFDNPNPGTRKPLPAVPVGTTSFTAAQIRQATGFRTITDLKAVQITAEI